MRRKALLSIMTIYHHCPWVFDELVIPETPTEIEGVKYIDGFFVPEKDTLIAGILSNCAELEIAFAEPETLQHMIGFWCKQNAPIWQKWLNTVNLAYNPIWNVDGDVTESKSTSNSGSYSETGSDTSIRQVAAFNSSAWENSEKNTGDDEKSGENASTGTESYHQRRTGNIGVTMTQEMIKKEREIAEFSFYQKIIDDFKRRFCLMIY